MTRKKDAPPDGIEYEQKTTLKVDANVARKLERTLDYIGPHLKLIIWSVSLSILFVSFCFALSLVLR